MNRMSADIAAAVDTVAEAAGIVVEAVADSVMNRHVPNQKKIAHESRGEVQLMIVDSTDSQHVQSISGVHY